MDAIEVIELCLMIANKGLPKSIPIERSFSVGEFQQLWRGEKTLVRPLLDGILCAEFVGDGLEALLRTGAMESLFPEISALKSMGDFGGIHKDVWEHTKGVVSNIEPDIELRWAALLHDLGKVKTRRIINKKVTFHNHDIVGERIVNSMDARTKLFDGDRALKSTVTNLVRFHLRPAAYKPSWTDSGVRRLVADVGGIEGMDKLLKLATSDMTTKDLNKRDKMRKRINELGDRVLHVVGKDNAPKLPKGTMGAIIVASSQAPGAWVNQLRGHLEEMLKDGKIPVGLSCDEYVLLAKELKLY
jgi:poly(A) polymerase